jgi:hypothetical protein
MRHFGRCENRLLLLIQLQRRPRFDQRSDIKDGAIQLILLWGFFAAEKQAS